MPKLPDILLARAVYFYAGIHPELYDAHYKMDTRRSGGELRKAVRTAYRAILASMVAR